MACGGSVGCEVSWIDALTWIMSAVTIATMWLAGNKNPLAWKIGLANQALWLTFIVGKEAWGLLPMCAAITFTYGRNLFKWQKPAPKPEPAEA